MNEFLYDNYEFKRVSLEDLRPQLVDVAKAILHGIKGSYLVSQVNARLSNGKLCKVYFALRGYPYAIGSIHYSTYEENYYVKSENIKNERGDKHSKKTKNHKNAIAWAKKYFRADTFHNKVETYLDRVMFIIRSKYEDASLLQGKFASLLLESGRLYDTPNPALLTELKSLFLAGYIQDPDIKVKLASIMELEGGVERVKRSIAKRLDIVLAIPDYIGDPVTRVVVIKADRRDGVSRTNPIPMDFKIDTEHHAEVYDVNNIPEYIAHAIDMTTMLGKDDYVEGVGIMLCENRVFAVMNHV